MLELEPLNPLYHKIGEGANPLDELKKLSAAKSFDLALVSAIGGFSEAVIGVFKGKEYEEMPVKALEGHVLEVVVFNGNIVSSPSGEYYPHIHVALARSNGEVYAGHLIHASVKPFLELFILPYKVSNKDEMWEMFQHRWKGL